VEAELEREIEFLRTEGREEEERAKANMVGLCATPFGVDVVGITESVALVGAVASGISARLRKAEAEKLNEQLRQVNQQLRQQARVGTLYAPGLSYAPTSVSSVGAPAEAKTVPGVTVSTVVADPEAAEAAHPAAAPAPASPALDSLDEPMDECRLALKEGKRLLKDGNGPSAMVRFEKALLLSRGSGNKMQERRATRGLAASAKLLGNYRKAISYLERVLELSKVVGDNLGDADAYGVIADCYTELDDYGTAAEYYDKYIDAMNRDGPV